MPDPCIAPIKSRVHPEFDFAGVEDPTRESTENLLEAELERLVDKFFEASQIPAELVAEYKNGPGMYNLCRPYSKIRSEWLISVFASFES